MRERLRQSFFAWGWLLPSLFPLAQISGRAVFTVLEIGYYVWAVLSLWGLRIDSERALRLCYGLLLLTFFVGIPGAESAGHALREWAMFAARSAIFFLTLGVLQRVDAGPERLLRAFGVAGLAVLVVLYFKLALALGKPGFDPRFALLEDNLPFLTPFMLLWARGRRPYGPWLTAPVIAAVLMYILYSEGRAALLGLATALGLYAVLALGYRARSVLALGLALAMLGLAAAPELLLRGAGLQGSPVDILDRLTSQRTHFWREALASPPEDLLTGVGMGNVGRGEASLSFPREGGGPPTEVKHLHNFVLDAWYETGSLGLAALLGWLACTLLRGVRAWRAGSGVERSAAGVLLAAAAAILVSGLLSFSYRSKPFSIYLPLFLGALVTLERGTAARAHRP